MQFLLLAYDGNDSAALERRLKVRENHLNKISRLKMAGEYLFGGAILDEPSLGLSPLFVKNIFKKSADLK